MSETVKHSQDSFLLHWAWLQNRSQHSVPVKSLTVSWVEDNFCTISVWTYYDLMSCSDVLRSAAKCLGITICCSWEGELMAAWFRNRN